MVKHVWLGPRTSVGVKFQRCGDHDYGAFQVNALTGLSQGLLLPWDYGHARRLPGPSGKKSQKYRL